MSERIRERDGAFAVYSEDGVEVGVRDTREEAQALVEAIDKAVARMDAGRTDGKRSTFRMDFAGSECSVLRNDAATRTTPSMGLRVEGRASRTGIYEYQDWDGKVIKELRPDEEVFDKDSLASYEDAPITDLHPFSFVDPENWQANAVGHVAGKAKRDGRFTRVAMAVQQSRAIRRLATRERVEISPGYTLEIDPTPGETADGEKYDRVQRKIRINHVAIGPKDWARGGPEVRVLMDSKGDDRPAPAGGDQMVLKFDGLEHQNLTEAGAQALLDRAAAASATATKERDEARARADAAEAALAKAKAELDAAKDPKAIEAAVKARSEFLAEIRSALGPDAKVDGKTDDELRREVILAAMPQARLEGLSDLTPHYRAALDMGANTRGSLADLQRVVGGPPARVDADKVRRERIARMNAGKPIAG